MIKILLIGFGILVILGALMTLPEVFTMIKNWKRLLLIRKAFKLILQVAGINASSLVFYYRKDSYNYIEAQVPNLTKAQAEILWEYGCEIKEDKIIVANRELMESLHPGSVYRPDNLYYDVTLDYDLNEYTVNNIDFGA